MNYRLVACGLFALIVVGCQAPKGNNTPGLKGYKLPPAPPERRDVAIDAGLRRAAEAEIGKAFAATDSVLRANAVEATQRSLRPGSGAPRVIAALADQSPVVRFAGAMAAGTLQLQAARPRLLTMTEDANKSVQVAVRYALHRLGDTRLSHDLEIFAKDPEERVRSNTALALGLLGEPSAKNILKVMARDVSPVVRLQVIEAQWRLGDTEARDELITGAVSKYADDQIVSLLALAAPKRKEVLRYVRGQLETEYDETELAAARAAGQLGSDDGMQVALNNVASPDARRRGMAALALGDIGRSDAQDQLRKLLLDRDPNVRLSAATAILQLRAA